jgi:hypothetical protein
MNSSDYGDSFPNCCKAGIFTGPPSERPSSAQVSAQILSGNIKEPSTPCQTAPSECTGNVTCVHKGNRCTPQEPGRCKSGPARSCAGCGKGAHRRAGIGPPGAGAAAAVPGPAPGDTGTWGRRWPAWPPTCGYGGRMQRPWLWRSAWASRWSPGTGSKPSVPHLASCQARRRPMHRRIH